eukprot:3225209-Rhodomonas_salina.2
MVFKGPSVLVIRDKGGATFGAFCPVCLALAAPQSHHPMFFLLNITISSLFSTPLPNIPSRSQCPITTSQCPIPPASPYMSHPGTALDESGCP